VFTDGFAFHANESAGRMNIATDTAQRMSLLRSGKYHIWTITWDDLPSAERKGKESSFHNLAFEGHKNIPIGKLDDPVHGAIQRLEPGFKKNSFEALVQYLSEPDAEAWKAYAHYLFFARHWQAIERLEKSGTGEWLSQFLERERPEEIAPGEAEPAEDPWLAGEFWFSNPQEQPSAKTGFFGPQDQVLNFGNGEDIHFFLCLFDHRAAARDKGFKQEWHGFWQFANLLQFLDHPWLITSTGLEEQRYPELRMLHTAPPQPGDQLEIPYVYQEAFEFADKQVHALLRKLVEADREPPEIGYELPGRHGEVAAAAELAWPEQKVAVTLPGQTESDTRGFTDLQWLVLSLEDCERDPDLLLEAIPQIQRSGI
jgi:DEAD/DEAH box helicase domain-containing protein